MAKPMGHSNSSSTMEVYSYRILPQETRKISNKQPTLYLKQLDKKRRSKTTKTEVTIKVDAKVIVIFDLEF